MYSNLGCYKVNMALSKIEAFPPPALRINKMKKLSKI